MSEVTFAISGNVATVVLNKPPNNHVSVENMGAIASALEELDKNRLVRAVVLASEGKNFCAGADLSTPMNVATQHTGSNPLYAQAVRLFSTKKPVIAAIQGAAVGAGLGLALIADHRVAATDARFAANFVKLAFHPGFGLTYTLPRLLGPQLASLMFLTGRRIPAEQALEWGLVDAIADVADVRAAAQKLAAEIAENAPLALMSTRATLRAGLAEAVRKQTDHEFKEQSWLRETKDFAEGVRSVAERRPGNFVGE